MHTIVNYLISIECSRWRTPTPFAKTRSTTNHFKWTLIWCLMSSSQAQSFSQRPSSHKSRWTLHLLMIWLKKLKIKLTSQSSPFCKAKTLQSSQFLSNRSHLILKKGKTLHKSDKILINAFLTCKRIASKTFTSRSLTMISWNQPSP